MFFLVFLFFCFWRDNTDSPKNIRQIISSKAIPSPSLRVFVLKLDLLLEIKNNELLSGLFCLDINCSSLIIDQVKQGLNQHIFAFDDFCLIANTFFQSFDHALLDLNKSLQRFDFALLYLDSLRKFGDRLRKLVSLSIL